ncbi:hypothetical protein EON65_53040 [archaeon]|nr:MAG: hypothetical protein EON65_53040 [archaeon]
MIWPGSYHPTRGLDIAYHKWAGHLYHRVSEVKRIHILTLKERGCTISQRASQTKVKQRTVEAVLHKRKQHHTIQDLPKQVDHRH